VASETPKKPLPPAITIRREPGSLDMEIAHTTTEMKLASAVVTANAVRD
jgi:hypothetical protein